MIVDSWAVAVDCLPIPALHDARDGVTAAVICDPSGSWAVDHGPAEPLAAALLERLLAPGAPAFEGRLHDAARHAPVRHPDDLQLDLAVLAARAVGPRVDVFSAGTCEALLLRGDAILARTARQIARVQDRRGSPLVEAALAHVTLGRDGTAMLTRPLQVTWTLRAGDVVLLASTRLAQRLVNADGPAVRALLDRRFHPNVVRALPDRDAPHGWTERHYSAIALWTGRPPDPSGAPGPRGG